MQKNAEISSINTKKSTHLTILIKYILQTIWRQAFYLTDRCYLLTRDDRAGLIRWLPHRCADQWWPDIWPQWQVEVWTIHRDGQSITFLWLPNQRSATIPSIGASVDQRATGTDYDIRFFTVTVWPTSWPHCDYLIIVHRRSSVRSDRWRCAHIDSCVRGSTNHSHGLRLNNLPPS